MNTASTTNTTTPPVIVSFDVGVKNLGVAIIDFTTHMPHVLELAHETDASDRLFYVAQLCETFNIQQAIIERQNARNTNAVRIEGALHGFFHARNIQVLFASPVSIKRKLDCPTGLTHAKRKKWAVDKVKNIIGLPCYSSHFTGTKEDDVCDALLNAWVVLKSPVLQGLPQQPSTQRDSRRTLFLSPIIHSKS
jgi:hypothetical protein